MPGSTSRHADARKAAFLNAFAKGGNVSAAARAAEVNRSTPYGWRDEDPDFAAAWDVAEQESIDRLELEARRRAEKGIEDYVVSQGKLVYIDDPKTGERVPLVRRVYSDTLMVLLLKAHRPEKYKDRQDVQLTGKDGGPVSFTLNIAPGEAEG